MLGFTNARAPCHVQGKTLLCSVRPWAQSGARENAGEGQRPPLREPSFQTLVANAQGQNSKLTFICNETATTSTCNAVRCAPKGPRSSALGTPTRPLHPVWPNSSTVIPYFTDKEDGLGGSQGHPRVNQGHISPNSKGALILEMETS